MVSHSDTDFAPRPPQGGKSASGSAVCKQGAIGVVTAFSLEFKFAGVNQLKEICFLNLIYHVRFFPGFQDPDIDCFPEPGGKGSVDLWPGD